VSKATAYISTNGPLFHPNYDPVGLLIIQRRTLFPINISSGHGNFFLQPNGVFCIHDGKAEIFETQAYIKQRKLAPDLAFQSGPLLLENGKIHPALKKASKSLYSRSAIGIDHHNMIHFVLFSSPTNLFSVANYFKEHLACHAALYLDGAISGIVKGDVEINATRDYGSVLVIKNVSR
jgi:uncharacterized protein YigE (DUF2233 family)